MKKSLLLVPLLAFLLVGCGNSDTIGENGGGGDNTGGNNNDDGGGDTPTYALIAKYDFTLSGHTIKGSELKTEEQALTLFDDSLVEGTDKLLSITDIVKVYDGNSSGGAYPETPAILKMGSSSSNGTFTLHFEEGTDVARTIVSCHDFYDPSSEWGGNTDYLSVNSDSQLTPFNEGATPSDLTYDFSEATDVLEFESMGSGTGNSIYGRVVIFSISLYGLS